MSFIGQAAIDGLILYTGTVATIGAGTALSTPSTVSAVVQVSGSSWTGIIVLEGSSDNISWSPLIVTNLADLSPDSQIKINGSYLLKCDTNFIRYNVQSITGSLKLVIVSNSTIASNPVDKLALAMDEFNNTPLNVKFQGGVKMDPSLALIPSDAPIEGRIQLLAGGFVIIDTTGYQSISFTTQLLAASISGSNDGITYSILSGSTVVMGSIVSAITGLQSVVFPCLTRYIKVSATTAGTATYYLRQQQLSLPYSTQNGANIASINAVSLTTINGGLSGTFGVGGSSAIGAVSTYNALLIAGGDPAGLTRKLATDQNGKIFIGNAVMSPAVSNAATTNAQSIQALTSIVNQVPINMQDTSQFEGQSFVELLAQILLELKVLNQQIYELPKILSTASQGASYATASPTVQLGDEPAVLRADPTLFNYQQ